jgi:hypothetical protein
MAEAVGDATPDRRPRRLYRVDGEVDAARDRRQAFGCETFARPRRNKKGVSFRPGQGDGARGAPAAGGGAAAAGALAGASSGVVMVEASQALASLVPPLPSSRAPK